MVRIAALAFLLLLVPVVACSTVDRRTATLGPALDRCLAVDATCSVSAACCSQLCANGVCEAPEP